MIYQKIAIELSSEEIKNLKKGRAYIFFKKTDKGEHIKIILTKEK